MIYAEADLMPEAVELEIKPARSGNLGVLAVIGAAVVIAVTVVLLLSGLSKGFSVSRTAIYTYMPEATGLTTQSEVRVSGLHVGSVSKVVLSGLLDPQRAVRIDMKVGTQYLPLIPADSITSISTDTMVGPAFVAIAQGKSSAVVRARSTLTSEPLKQAADRADLVRAFENRLREIDQVVQEVSSPTTAVGRFVVGDAEYVTLLGEISAFERSLHALSAEKSPLGQALFTDALYQQIRLPLTRMAQTLTAIQSGEGAAGHLFASDEQYNTMVHQLRALRQTLSEANQGKGTLGPLLKDDGAHRRMLALIRDSDALLKSVTTGPGAGPDLLRNPAVYEALTGSLRELTALMKDFREEPKKYLRYKPF